MNIWRFAGFAFSQSQHSPHPLAHSPSAAEPALATWPQLKMRKVDEKSKKFSVSPLSPSLSFSLPTTKRNGIFSWVASSTRPSKTGGLWNGRFCWVAVASAAVCGRRTATGTLLQLQLQQHVGQQSWAGAAGRYTVDTFNDYCRPLKITSKSFAHKAASGIHARQEKNPKGDARRGETLCRILSQLQLLILSQQSRYSLFLSLAQHLAMKSPKFKFNSSQLRISSICIIQKCLPSP